MGVYPTLGSLREVLDMGVSKLPIEDQNDLYTLLFTYHNTLLQEVEKTNENQNRADSRHYNR